MVICKYFLNGNCRFGSKCVNEHLDIKQILKSEIEAAIRGSQWPLSCFGAFKEKPCIPNFIEDQSFEEIRQLCYEAKKQNCFPQFQQQFNQKVLEAHNKMNQLLSLNPEAVNIVTQIYEAGTEQNKGTSLNSSNNPFSSIGNSSSNSSANLFGSSQVQTNPFAKPTSSTFSSNANVFGANATVAGQGNLTNNNIFANTASQASIFGGIAQQNQLPQQIQNNPFGGAFKSQQSTNIFGGQAQAHKNSIFGGNNQESNQHNQSFGNIFSSNNSSNTTNVFNSNPSTQSSIFEATPASSIFSQTQSIQQPFANQDSGFNNQTQNKSLTFSSFLQNTNQQLNNPSQPFMQQPTNGSVFGSNIQQPTQNIFAQAVQQQKTEIQQQPVQGSIFGLNDNTQNNPQNPTIQNFLQPQLSAQTQQQPIFFNPQHSQAQNQPGGTININPAENASQNIFNQNPSNQSQNQSHFKNDLDREGVYSKLESLTQEVLESFKAEHFCIGKIPTVPPPKELCF